MKAIVLVIILIGSLYMACINNKNSSMSNDNFGHAGIYMSTKNGDKRVLNFKKINDSLAIFVFFDKENIVNNYNILFSAGYNVQGLAYKKGNTWIGYIDETEIGEKNQKINHYVIIDIIEQKDDILEVEIRHNNTRFFFVGKYKYAYDSILENRFDTSVINPKFFIWPFRTDKKYEIFEYPDTSLGKKGFLNSNTDVRLIHRYKEFYHYYYVNGDSINHGWFLVSNPYNKDLF